MSYNQHFDQLLEDMGALHERKGHDYAREDNPYSNFEEAAHEAGVDTNTVFKVMVAIKNARIRELEQSGKTPRNEALLDSYMDGLMYRALQLSYLRKQAKENELKEWVADSEKFLNECGFSAPEGSYGHGV